MSPATEQDGRVSVPLVGDGTVIYSNPAAESLMSIITGQTPTEWVVPNEVRLPNSNEIVPASGRPLKSSVGAV